MRDYSPVDKIVDNYNEKIFEWEKTPKLVKKQHIKTEKIKQALLPKLENLDKKSTYCFTYKELWFWIVAFYFWEHKQSYLEERQNEYSWIVVEYRKDKWWGFYVSYDTNAQKYYLIND